MIKQECIGIPDMILLLMIFCFKKIKIKAEIVLSPGGAYFWKIATFEIVLLYKTFLQAQKELTGAVDIYFLTSQKAFSATIN